MDPELNELKQNILNDIDPEKKISLKKERRRIYIIAASEFLAIILLGVMLFWVVYGMSKVSGVSMYPTLRDGERVFFIRAGRHYNVGDIVAVDLDDEKDVVKRVIAVAGDNVNVTGGKVFVNGEEAVVEEAVGKTFQAERGIKFPIVVGDGEVFLLGDNREFSRDSRDYGCVPISRIKGKLDFYYGRLG